MYDIKALHYGFRRRANKVDSLQNRNFYVEQIDDYLNEALNLYINEMLKVSEINRTIEDNLRILIKNNAELNLVDSVDGKYILAELPSDYLRQIRNYSEARATCCNTLSTIKHYRIQGDDESAYMEDPLYKPSYLYRETGYRITGNHIKVLTGELIINKVYLDYYAKHPKLGNPESARTGAYNLPDGTPAVQQSLLFENPRQADVIMDIAVLAAHTDMNSDAFKTQLTKLTQTSNITTNII